MKIFIRIFFIISVLASNYCYPQSMVPGAVFGYTKGSFSVSEGGAATYSIPIQVSSGTAGMQPNLAINYNSQGEDGFLGRGFSLSGFSSIIRASQNVTSDYADPVWRFSYGKSKGIRFDKSDRFYLDGERLNYVDTITLIPNPQNFSYDTINKRYGVPNVSTYQKLFRYYIKQNNDFSKILIGDTLSNGSPSYFIVYKKDGLIYEYGNSNDSRISLPGASDKITEWKLKKIKDRFNNYIEFIYSNNLSTGENYPTEIKYTGNDSLAMSTYASVKFIYANGLLKEGYRMGAKYLISKYLTNIVCLYNLDTIRTYNIIYNPYDSLKPKIKFIHSIQECVGNSDCLTATEFLYDNPTSSLSLSSDNFPLIDSSLLVQTNNKQTLFADFNKDGLTDIFIFNNNTGNIQVYKNNGNGTSTIIPIIYKTSTLINLDTVQSTYILFNALQQGFVTLSDFNADGFTDILWQRSYCDGVNLTSTGMWQLPTVFRNDTLEILSYTSVDKGQCMNGLGNIFSLNDINGNGIPDFIRMYQNGSTIKIDSTQFKFNTFLPFYFNAGITPVGYDLGGLPIPIFNNSGYYGLDSSLRLQIQNLGLASNIKDSSKYFFRDFNGDGYADLFIFFERTGLNYFIPLNETPIYGSTQIFIAPTFTFNPLLSVLQHHHSFQTFIPGVINPLFTLPNVGNTSINPVLPSLLKLQNDLNPLPCSNNTDPQNWKLTIQDINGDNLPDLLWIDQNGGASRFFINKGDFSFDGPITPTCSNCNDSLEFRNSLLSSCSNFINYYFDDINSDGLIDLHTIPLNGISTNLQYWFVNNGDFTFRKILDSSFYKYKNQLHDSLYISVPGQWYANKLNTSLQINKLTGSNKIIKGSESKSDLVHYIIGGVNQQIEINYKLYTDTSIGKIVSVNNTFPVNTFIAPLILASSVKFPSGMNDGFYLEKKYSYEDAMLDVGGNGFRGFKAISIQDVQSGILQKTKYIDSRNNYQYKGDNRESYKIGLLSDGRIISKSFSSKYILEYNQGYLPISFFAYSDTSTSINYDLNGSVVDSVITFQKVDSFGNALNIVVNYGNGIKDSTVNYYYNDSVRWLLSRLTYSKLYRFAPGQPTIVRSSAFEYDSITGKLKKEIANPDESPQLRSEKRYNYDARGNIISDSLIAWNGTTTEYRVNITTFDSLGRFVISKTNPLGQQSYMGYDNGTGNVISSTNINGLTTTFTYDAFGRSNKVTTPDGNWMKYDYRKCDINFPSQNNSTWLIYKQFSSSPVQKEYYDIHDRNVYTENIGFNGNIIITKSTFNSMGQVIQKPDPYFLGANQFNTTTTYDSMNRVSSITLPGNRTESILYNGKEKIITNALGQIKKVLNDDKGRTIKVTDNNNKELSYVYDAQGNLIKTTDSKGNTIISTYDIRGLRISLNDPDMGLYQYQYNGFGELVQQTNPDGQVIINKYDKLGRIIQVNEPEGITSYTYDTGNKGIGKISTVIDYNGNGQFYYYDNLGRDSILRQKIVGDNYDIKYHYDSKGRVDTTTYPGAFKIRYLYNTNDYLSEIKRVSDNKSIWKAITINAKGQLEKASLGNGIDDIHVYNDTTGFQERVRAHKSSISSNLMNLQTSFDKIGNLVFRKDSLLNKQENFSYDNLNRLTLSKIIGGDSVAVQYDELGNITYKSDVGTYEYGSVNNGPHRLIKVNLIGNVCIPSFVVSTEFTSFNKAKRVYNDTASLQITYGSDNQRIVGKLTVNGNVTKTKIYVGGVYEKEITGSQTRELYYIKGIDGVVAVDIRINNTDSLNYWHKDHLGSLTMITNDAGNIVEKLSFDAWGKRRNSNWSSISDSMLASSSFTFDRGFTGHEHYDLFDIVDMNGRMYDPVLGRFLSADPFIQTPDNMQNYNRYSYVLNNPLSYTDPSGYFFGSIWRAITSVVNIVKSAAQLAFEAHKLVVEKAFNYAKENWKTILVVAIAIAVPASLVALGYLGTATLGSAIAAGAIGGFSSSFTSSFLNGGNIGDALKGGLRGAVISAATAGMAYGVGDAAGAVGNKLGDAGYYGTKVVGHGTSNGLISLAQGGKFEHGFITGAISGGTEDVIGNNLDNDGFKIAASAVVGGTTSELTGGSFENGAITGAYTMMFNQLSHNMERLNAMIERRGRAEVMRMVYNSSLNTHEKIVLYSAISLEGNMSDRLRAIRYAGRTAIENLTHELNNYYNTNNNNNNNE